MALDNNVDLAADRLDPQISDTRVAAAAGVFRPTFNTGVQREQPAAAAVELPDAGRARAPTSSRSNAGLEPAPAVVRHVLQPRRGRRRTPNSNSILNSYNPLLQSGLSLNVSQPLLRDLSIDSNRAAARDQQDQPRHRRHAAAREPGAHDGEREGGVLESGVGARQRRRAASRRSISRRSWCASTRPRWTSARRRRSIWCRRRRRSPPTRSS